MVPMRAPLAFFISNRSDTVLQGFERIARARPPWLYAVDDGPPPDHAGEGEAEQSAAARAIVDRIEWPCQVRTNYSDVNLGRNGRRAISFPSFLAQIPGRPR